MSFQYVSSMCLLLRRNQAATVDPSAETLSSRGQSLTRILGVVGVALLAAWLAVKAAGRPRHRANIFVDLSRPDNALRLDAGGC